MCLKYWYVFPLFIFSYFFSITGYQVTSRWQSTSTSSMRMSLNISFSCLISVMFASVRGRPNTKRTVTPGTCSRLYTDLNMFLISVSRRDPHFERKWSVMWSIYLLSMFSGIEKIPICINFSCDSGHIKGGGCSCQNIRL